MNRRIKNPVIRKFIFSCTVTLAVLLVVMTIGGGVYAGIQSLAKPPVMPSYVEIRPQTQLARPENSSPEGTGMVLPQEDEEDDDVTIMLRKPNFYTFLVFGIDNSNNADVIIVAALDTVKKEAYMISIPRDTRIETTRRLRKPVSAYSAGRANGGGVEGGVAEMTSDIKSLFGFEPDFHIRIDYRAVERAIDTLGGVLVNVPFHMRYDDPTDNLHINIAAGQQRLNGRQAIQFARYRMGNEGYPTITDYQRVANQQQVIRAMFNELMTPATIARIPELITIYREHVHTNMDYSEMLWFGGQLAQLRGMTLSTQTIPTTGTSGSPGWYELPDRDGILELINKTINPFVDEITAEMVNIAE